MIKRTIFSKLVDHVSSDQMTILIGPRQAGKTYLMRLLQNRLIKEGKKTVWLNLDHEEDKRLFSSQRELLTYIKLQAGKERAVVFIDEVQRKENAGLFLKGIFDRETSYKFIVSGSGSLELKAKIPESMAGRKQLFVIDPISFPEFVNFRTNYRYEDRLLEFFKIEIEKTNYMLKEYLTYGGYPRVVLAETTSLKQDQMQEIYRSYIERDIHALLRLEKTDAFTSLLKIIASQIGTLVNVTELASTVGIDQKTIKQYLFYLEQTFIIKKVTPYFRNVRSEITKAPLYYFVDIGLRNWLLGLFGLPEIPTPLSGHLFENTLFNMMKSTIGPTATQIHFWRTKDQAEVDFVLETGLSVTPVEAKYKNLSFVDISKSFRSFLTRYQPSQGYIVHTGSKEEKKRIGKTDVRLIPFYQLTTQTLGKP